MYGVTAKLHLTGLIVGGVVGRNVGCLVGCLVGGVVGGGVGGVVGGAVGGDVGGGVGGDVGIIVGDVTFVDNVVTVCGVVCEKIDLATASMYDVTLNVYDVFDRKFVTTSNVRVPL